MKIQAEVSLYPLRKPTLTEWIHPFVEHLRQNDLEVETGAMSSTVSGECEDLFRALGEAYEKAAQGGDMVLTVKITNACLWNAG
ncbi:MAG TPA: YkoF family thiamine/hydroxymethylpyrimidine-binding protein [archaeon]|nr:YkoF family thiamine/hydroxymethylpyrimidine-binding protein [archaeon]